MLFPSVYEGTATPSIGLLLNYVHPFMADAEFLSVALSLLEGRKGGWDEDPGLHTANQRHCKEKTINIRDI